MTKDEVLKRIAELTNQKRQNEALFEQHKANANACQGAIQELSGWLKKIELKEKEDAEKLEKEKQEKEAKGKAA